MSKSNFNNEYNYDDDLGKKFCLSHSDSVNRKNNILDSVSYDIKLTLRSKNDVSKLHPKIDYEGLLLCTFNTKISEEKILNEDNLSESDYLSNTDKFIFFDAYNYPIKIEVNGKIQQKILLFKQKLFLSNKDININGKNTVKIYFYGKYSTQGVGLHYFKDNIDGKEYLYTKFEPFECHRLFPCFDQPNIKATYSLTLITPNEWNVFANEYEKSTVFISEQKISSLSEEDENFLIRDNLLNKYKLNEFEETFIISTYLFALAVGNYVIFENTLNPEFKVKMRVIYRDSLKQFENKDEIFKLTMGGIEFYEEYFKIPYPFKKYDQIFVPEFVSGAMENVGLVTFNDVYVWKSSPTYRRKNSFAITVLHELAHMWFGNLVTMDWWDDLWLNEAFATFISHLCLDKKFKEDYNLSWILFNFWKGFAYNDDQSITTHPVMGLCPHTEFAETSFDSITYEKGSAILKQIYYIIGFHNFSNSIKEYFIKHSYKNTIYDDFISELEVFSKGISENSNNWLKKSGLTSISVSSIEFKNNECFFIIKQKPCIEIHPNIYNLVMDIALYYNDCNNPIIMEKVKINNSEETLIKINDYVKEKYSLSEMPQAILLNYNDWSYVKVSINNESIKYFRNNLPLMKDTLSKLMIYRSFYDMLRDGDISGLEYVNLICELISCETDVDIVTPQIRYGINAVNSYIPTRFYNDYSFKMFNLCLNLLEKACSLNNVELLKNVLMILPSCSLTESALRFLFNILKQIDSENLNFEFESKIYSKTFKGTFKSTYLSQNIRFNIVEIIYGSSYFDEEEKNKLVEDEILRDNNSEDSLNLRYYCKSTSNNQDCKKEIWDKFINHPKSETLATMEIMMSAFVRFDQLELVKHYVCELFFTGLEKLKQSDRKYINYYIEHLNPILFASEEILDLTLKHVELYKEFEIIKKGLSDLADDIKKKIRNLEVSEKYVLNNNIKI